MEKYINLVLDLPNKVNSMLPKNCYNEAIEGSEKSINSWIGYIFKILSFGFAILTVYLILKQGIESMKGADALNIVGSILTMLIFLYVTFPLSMFFRSTASTLSSSESGIITFFFKDFVVAVLKLLGYLGALIALATAIAGTVSFVLDGYGVYGHDFFGLAEQGSAAMTAFLLTILGFIEPLNDLLYEMEDLLAMIDLRAEGYIMVDGWSVEGLLQLLSMYVAPLVILIQLFITLAIYHFVYGLISTFLNWIKGPYFPIKVLK
tara:strand:- start:173 stop:961 length:789 start_codon:yes stop_codon:yes gene_type:complete